MRRTTRDKPPAQAKRASQRRSERFQRQFHSEEYVRFTRHCSCVACGRTSNPYRESECSHHPSRGAGGGYEDISPLCRDCHANFHSWGQETFQRRMEVDLKETNRLHWKAFQDYGEEWP